MLKNATEDDVDMIGLAAWLSANLEDGH